MRRAATAWLGAVSVVAAGAAAAQEQPSTPASPATRADAHAKQMEQEHVRNYYFAVSEQDYARTEDDEDLLTWDATGWYGGDRNRLWVKSEGEIEDGDVGQAELQALYSRNVSTFFDAQVGLRYDFEPDDTAYLAAGLQGLAPYQFETEAFAFLSEKGDVSFRFEQEIELLFTQRLILQPRLELEAFAQDVREDDPPRPGEALEPGVGAGLSNLEASLMLRYEITRRFAPYVDLSYERALGETSQLIRAAGEDPEETTLRAGLRLWF